MLYRSQNGVQILFPVTAEILKNGELENMSRKWSQTFAILPWAHWNVSLEGKKRNDYVTRSMCFELLIVLDRYKSMCFSIIDYIEKSQSHG